MKKCLHRYLDFPHVVGTSDKTQPHTHSLQYQHCKRPLQVVAVNQIVQKDLGKIYITLHYIKVLLCIDVHLRDNLFTNSQCCMNNCHFADKTCIKQCKNCLEKILVAAR